MRVLVGCESSGAVRSAFRALGHDAWSCDLLAADDGSEFHYQCDVLSPLVIGQAWDLGIFHPPCTYLCSSGLHWNKRVEGRAALTEASLVFVRTLLGLDIPHIALENPVGCISTRIRKPDCIIQPWQFGHPESKTTCLWLKNLPPLVPTNVLAKPASGRWDNMTPSGQNKLGPSADRWKERSKTYEGIALAMAAQWSAHCLSSMPSSVPSVTAVESPSASSATSTTLTAPTLDLTPRKTEPEQLGLFDSKS